MVFTQKFCQIQSQYKHTLNYVEAIALPWILELKDRKRVIIVIH